MAAPCQVSVRAGVSSGLPQALSDDQRRRIRVNKEAAKAKLSKAKLPESRTSSCSRCCKCCATGKCVRCSCVTAGRSCVDCFPSQQGNCANLSINTNIHNTTTIDSSTSGGNPVSHGNLSEVTLPGLPSIEEVLKVKVSTLHHVPKGARSLWGSLLATVLDNVTSNPKNNETFVKLFMLPRCILFSPVPTSKNKSPNDWRVFENLVKSRIGKWNSGCIPELWSEAVSHSNSARSNTKRSQDSSDTNIRRAKQAMEDGQYSKAAQALTSTGLIDPSPESLEQMLAKHPQAPPPIIPSDPSPLPIRIDNVGISRAIKSFPNGTAPGPSGLRASHLKEAVSCPASGNVVLTSLSQFANLMCSGGFPSSYASFFCGADLIAIRKPNGGLRPIAIGEILRRLISKCVVMAVRLETLKALSPLQVGVGVPGGCEAVVHALYRVLENDDISPDLKWSLQLDFSNAFNGIDRASMFLAVRERIPSVAPWLEWCYGSLPNLYFGDYVISSCCGVQQGDPLGPLAFALTLHSLVEKIQLKVPGLLLNTWYLDDGILCGSPQDLSLALDILCAEGKSYGLTLQFSKSLLYIPDTSVSTVNPISSVIPITSSGFVHLGIPIGSPAFCISILSDVFDKTLEMLSLLSALRDSQMAITLLRSCMGFSTISFSLRSLPSHYIAPVLESFDNNILQAFEELLGCPISPWTRLKISLPVSLGGLNIRSSSIHAPAAYLGSLVQTTPLVRDILGEWFIPSPHEFLSVSALAETASCHQWISLNEVDVSLTQRSFSKVINNALFEKLVSTAPDVRSRALSLSTSIKHAGDWLSVIPSRALGLHVQDRDFCCCLRYWLSIPLCEEGYCPVCGAPTDPFGDHYVMCKGLGDRIWRHDNLKEVIFSAARSAALAPRKEIPALIPGSNSRPADVYLPIWERGASAALDVTVISPLQSLTINQSAVTQGHAITVARSRKFAAHGEACRGAGVVFIPLVVESLGGWCKESASVIARIARLQGHRLNNDIPDSVHHLFQRLSISLWKSNATMWANRATILPPAVDGVL